MSAPPLIVFFRAVHVPLHSPGLPCPLKIMNLLNISTGLPLTSEKNIPAVRVADLTNRAERRGSNRVASPFIAGAYPCVSWLFFVTSRATGRSRLHLRVATFAGLVGPLLTQVGDRARGAGVAATAAVQHPLVLAVRKCHSTHGGGEGDDIGTRC
jgi:hypothetical protein